MNTTEIEMSPRHARTEAERYSRCANLTAKDKIILRAYKTIAHGGRIIDLNKTMAAAGFTERGFPKLAIATAASEQTTVLVWTGSMRFRSSGGPWKRRETRVGVGNNKPGGPLEAWARLPYIPPYIRRSRMSKYLVLWEAQWFDRPAGDPFLLEKVGENLYRIVAGWDLTPVEASVL